MPPTARHPPRLLPWLIIVMVSSVLCLCFPPNPSPLFAWIAYANYHHLHLTWNVVDFFQRSLPIVLPLLTIVAAIQTHRAARHTPGCFLFAFSKLAIIFAGIAILCFACFLLPVFDGGHTWSWRERTDALRAVHEIAELQTYTDPPRRPAHLAQALADGLLSERLLRYRYSPTPQFPASLPSTNDWTMLIPLVNTHSDFIYLGTDLPLDSIPTPFASQLIIAYGKRDLPEFPDYHHAGGGHYEYAYAARPVAFADGLTALILSSNFPATFAAHNAARAALHLPPQQIDVPP